MERCNFDYDSNIQLALTLWSFVALAPSRNFVAFVVGADGKIGFEKNSRTHRHRARVTQILAASPAPR